MQAQAPQPAPVALPQQYGARYAAPQKGHAQRNVSLGCLGLIVLAIFIGILANAGKPNSPSLSSSSNASVESPVPPPSPMSEPDYKASAKAIPYVQLEKDPASLAGTVVTYTGQVVQYDTNTTTSHLRIDVTNNGGFYTDTIWLDVDPSQTTKVFRDTVIQFWGEVVGPYTYTSVTGAQITIPEVNARYVKVVG